MTVGARCCGISSETVGNSIFLPAELWGNRNLEDYFKPRKIRHPDGHDVEIKHHWRVGQPRKVPMKNMPDLEIVEITSDLMHLPSLSADDRARRSFEGLKREGTYNPLRYGFESK